MTRILVTGANGFVGQRVCRRLLASGFFVRALVRRESAVAMLDRRCEPYIGGDIESFRQWDQALEDVTAVVHLVARTHHAAERGAKAHVKYLATNVQGTDSLVQACVRCGVSRLVFVSSIKAVGEGADHPYAETDISRPEDSYGISKLQAEQRVLQAGGALMPVILRPPLVYGPGVGGNFRRLLTAVERGLPLPLGAVSNARSLIYVDNLAAAIVAALVHPRAAGQIFHVADRQAVSTPELIRLLAEALGKPARLARVPAPLLRAAAAVCGRQAVCRRLIGSLTLRCDKIEKMLGWTPPYSLHDGIRKTAASFMLTGDGAASAAPVSGESLLLRN